MFICFSIFLILTNLSSLKYLGANCIVLLFTNFNKLAGIITDCEKINIKFYVLTFYSTYEINSFDTSVSTVLKNIDYKNFLLIDLITIYFKILV